LYQRMFRPTQKMDLLYLAIGTSILTYSILYNVDLLLFFSLLSLFIMQRLMYTHSFPRVILLIITTAIMYFQFYNLAYNSNTLYDVMEVNRIGYDPTDARIKFRSLSKKYHPDKMPNNDNTMFERLNLAKSVLSEPTFKQVYESSGEELLSEILRGDYTDKQRDSKVLNLIVVNNLIVYTMLGFGKIIIKESS